MSEMVQNVIEVREFQKSRLLESSMIVRWNICNSYNENLKGICRTYG